MDQKKPTHLNTDVPENDGVVVGGVVVCVVWVHSRHLLNVETREISVLCCEEEYRNRILSFLHNLVVFFFLLFDISDFFSFFSSFL